MVLFEDYKMLIRRAWEIDTLLMQNIHELEIQLTFPLNDDDDARDTWVKRRKVPVSFPSVRKNENRAPPPLFNCSVVTGTEFSTSRICYKRKIISCSTEQIEHPWAVSGQLQCVILRQCWALVVVILWIFFQVSSEKLICSN